LKDDFYADAGVLFSSCCDHNVDFLRVDTAKDRME